MVVLECLALILLRWLVHRGLLIVVFGFLAAFPPDPLSATESDMLLREDFNDLEDWEPLYFPRINKHTRYSIATEAGQSYLKAESDASASGLVFKKEFNVFAYPHVKWRWQVSNVFSKGDARKKSGDDYPLRVYIIFKYNPDKASFSQKIKYGLAKSIYGEYPPHSSLNYIWANRSHDKQVIPNPYAEEARMIPLQSGAELSGRWVEQNINIVDDYRIAFGEDPPATASLAIMSDADNTGESAVGFIDYIEVYRN